MAVETLTNEGMPTHSGDLSIEGRGIEPVPATARYGSVGRIFSVWFTPNLVPAAFFIGTLAAAGFLQVGFITGVLAIIVGNVVGSILVGLLGTMGPKTGMAQMPLARAPYGKSIVVPGLLNWLSCIGWDGINSIFGAAALSLLTGDRLRRRPHRHRHLPGGARRHRLRGDPHVREVHGGRPRRHVRGPHRRDPRPGQHRAGSTASPGSTSSAPSSCSAPSAPASCSPGRSMPRTTAATCRRAPRRPAIFWNTVLALTISAGWLEILGLMVADKVTGTSVGTIRDDILGGGILGALAMVAIALGTIAVNAINDYTGSLSLQAAGVRIPRIVSALIVAVAGFFFTLYLNSGDFAGKFESYLLFISYWIAPWAAVVLVDWWLRRGRIDTASLMRFSALPSGLLGLASLLMGFIVSLPFQQSSVRRGPSQVDRPADQRDQRRRPPLRRLRVSHRLRGRGARLLDRVAHDQPIRRSADGRRPGLSRLAFQPGARHRWD